MGRSAKVKDSSKRFLLQFAQTQIYLEGKHLEKRTIIFNFVTKLRRKSDKIEFGNALCSYHIRLTVRGGVTLEDTVYQVWKFSFLSAHTRKLRNGKNLASGIMI